MTLQDVKTRLMERIPLVPDPNPQNLTRTWLDSFDWRVYQAGGLIVMESNGQRKRLAWFDLSSGVSPHPQEIEEFPGFAWDLPAGDLKASLAKVLEMRTLLPLVRVRNTVTVLRQLSTMKRRS